MATKKSPIEQCYKIIHQISQNLDEANYTGHRSGTVSSDMSEPQKKKTSGKNINHNKNQ